MSSSQDSMFTNIFSFKYTKDATINKSTSRAQTSARRVMIHKWENPGAGFMKGLKSGLRLKSETLGSNIVNILLSLWSHTQSISQTGST